MTATSKGYRAEEHSGRGNRELRAGPRYFMRRLAAIKEAVRVEAVASEYTELRAVGGGRLIGRCVSPMHRDRTPSMSIYVAEQRFRCFGCGEGGDVLDLCMLAESGDLREALEELARRYHVALPERPPAWHRKRERQRDIRNGIEDAKLQRARERLYRRFFAPLVESVEDPEVRAHDAQAFWEATDPLARLLIGRMMGGRR